MILIAFKVEGNGDFPSDMLRYDACWPRDIDSAKHICSGKRFHFGKDFSSSKIEIELLSRSIPTKKRWESFGWVVVEPQQI